MTKFNMLIMMMISSIMMFVTHPLLLSMFILIQTLLVCVFSRMYLNSSWLPMTIFMVMVGGLMVIFIYTTSLCSNSKFKKLMLVKPLFYFLISLFLLMFPLLNILNHEMIELMDLFNMEMFKLFLPLNMIPTMFMFLYLLMVLIIMINLMMNEKGPMRKKY